MKVLLVVHAAATFYMAGIIWFVQIVHYPLFGSIGEPNFIDCQRFHLSRVTWIVAPGMAAETVTAALLVFLHPTSLLLKLGAALLALIWWTTIFRQVPRHNVLALGYNVIVHRGLVRSNWIRTCAWTLRGVIAAGLLLA